MSSVAGSIEGILVIDKPAGMTSAAVVAQVKRMLREVKRVGHTGTLDPMATGVLPLCLGEATKIAGYLLAEDKTYHAELELGVETDTLDAEGQVTARRAQAAATVTEEDVRQVMAEFVGPGTQVPPMYSALKHQGKRLHELARAGKTVEREPRPIHIYELRLLAFEPPRVRFAVHCSKGTYVRTLAADMGERLGCGAHLSALRRVQSGMFRIEDAVELAGLDRDLVAQRIVSTAKALGHLPGVVVPLPLADKVANGLGFPWSRLGQGSEPPDSETVIRLLTVDGALLALATVDPHGLVRYRRVFKGSLLAT